MGQDTSRCEEIYGIVDSSYWVYLIIFVALLLLILFALPITIIVCAAISQVKYVGVIARWILQMIKWADLNANSVPAIIHHTIKEDDVDDVKMLYNDDPYEFGTILGNNDLVEPAVLEKKKTKVTYDVKDVSRVAGGYFTLMLVVFALCAMVLSLYTYLTPLGRQLNEKVEPIEFSSSIFERGPIFFNTTSGIRVQYTIPNCGSSGSSRCSDLTAHVMKNGNQESPVGFSCQANTDGTCSVVSTFTIAENRSINSFVNFKIPVDVYLGGYIGANSPMGIQIRYPFMGNGMRRNMNMDDAMIFIDSCRNIPTIYSNTSYLIHINTMARRRCEQRFGTVDACMSSSFTFPTYQTLISNTAMAPNGGNCILLRFYISPLTTKTFVESRSGLALFTTLFVFLLAILVFQPMFKKFIATLVVNGLLRVKTGQGIGFCKALFTGVFAGCYLGITLLVIYLFISIVMIGYQLQLPFYVFGGGDVVWNVIVAHWITSLVFVVGWIVIAVGVGLIVTLFLGMDSKGVRAKRRLRASSNKTTNDATTVVNNLELQSPPGLEGISINNNE